VIPVLTDNKPLFDAGPLNLIGSKALKEGQPSDQINYSIRTATNAGELSMIENNSKIESEVL
jgi:hypothetical protein